MELENSAAPVEQTETQKVQSRMRLFLILSLLWLFPSLGAIWILSIGLGRWREATGIWRLLQMVRLEEWLALALLILQVAFMLMTYRCRRRILRDARN